jgi:hypothetical protein
MRFNLEIQYIEHLDETYYRGYASQLLHDNEKKFYEGMRAFLSEWREECPIF